LLRTWRNNAVNVRGVMNGKVTLLMTMLLAVRPAAAGDTHLDFEVSLDSRPVGTHRFDILRAADGSQTVRSVAEFEVKILGFIVYRYRHEATERWEQGCLVQIKSSTNDNGRALQVSRVFRDGCVSSYAYWDPARLLQQRELLNPQTGEFDPVQIESLGEETLVVRGAPVLADRYRLSNGKLVIDLWYSKAGEWLQLDSTTPSNRKLHYRLAGITTANRAPSPVSNSDRSPP
jgi:hypothetical protein